MAYIQRQRTNKRTTEKCITEKDPVSVRSSSHDPETGEMLHLTFKLAAANSSELGESEESYLVTLTKEDVEILWAYTNRERTNAYRPSR